MVPTSTTAPGVHWPTGDGEAAATAALWGWLGRDAATAHLDLARPAARAAQARLCLAATLPGRARIAASDGGGARLNLGALPTPCPSGPGMGRADMRVAVPLWLGVPPVPAGGRLLCRCGGLSPADGAHILGECAEQVCDRTRRHHTVSHLVADALRAPARLEGVALEQRLVEDL